MISHRMFARLQSIMYEMIVLAASQSQSTSLSASSSYDTPLRIVSWCYINGKLILLWESMFVLTFSIRSALVPNIRSHTRLRLHEFLETVSNDHPARTRLRLSEPTANSWKQQGVSSAQSTQQWRMTLHGTYQLSCSHFQSCMLIMTSYWLAVLFEVGDEIECLRST